MTRIDTRINGANVTRDVEARVTLAEFVRNELGLTGTKLSCELEVCGACTVVVDGNPVSACTSLAVDVDGREVLTIEGLADGDELHPIQRAFIDHFAMQCGFCTPGFILMAKTLLDDNPEPTEEDVVHHMEGNICRCTGYRPIIDAVIDAADRMRAPR